jgi:ADP-dependent NAD(P)H-hydrate dehydratase / NAD(P)H-hydrate epimerase
MNELLTTHEMGQADRLAGEAGIPALDLMERAGRAVATAAIDLTRGPDTRVAVLCGPGNNGGDGFVAARLLRDQGFDVRVFLLGDKSDLKGDAAEMARRWPLPIRPASPDALQSMHLVIDALFGAGLARPLEGDGAELVKAVNESGIRVLSVDVPSGVDGTSGEVRGVAIHARRTITFFRKKPGHVLMPGRSLCGETIVVDIGIPERVLETIKPSLHENEPAQWRGEFPWPADGHHKYDRGHAVVVAGPPLQTGATRLAARGALRAGAGLVTLVGSAASATVMSTQITSIMVRAAAGATALSEILSDTRKNAVLIGPGASVGPETVKDVLAVLASSAAVVLDADALTSFASEDEGGRSDGGMGFLARNGERRHTPEGLFSAIKSRSAPVVLTPHEGEFKRLFGELQGSKVDRTREAARRSGAVVLLKGSDTVIATPGGNAAINSNGSAWLATAGSGDVLGGIIAGLLAQHMPAFEAACAGCWLHGAAARHFGPGLISEDLPDLLPGVLRGLFENQGQKPR